MSEDKLSGLEDMFAVDAATVAALETPESPYVPVQAEETKPVETPTAEAGQPRDESGRFAPKTEQAPAQVATPEPQPTPKKSLTPDDVPVLIELREKAKAAEERAAKLEADLAAIREQQQAPQPSYLDDPEGYMRRIEERTEARINEAETRWRFQSSMEAAREKHGNQLVDDAVSWGIAQCKTPQGKAFYETSTSHPRPVDWIIKEYKRDQLLAQIGDDEAAYVRKRYAELNAAPGQHPSPQVETPATPQPASQTPQQITPTRSLASASGAGGVASVPMGEFAALDAMYSR